MTEQMDLSPVVKAWLQETLPPLADSSHIFDEVSEQAGRTRQQPRWWPGISVAARPTVVPGVPRHRVEAETPRAADGSAATRGRGLEPMFSMVKIVAAAAIVALFGGFLLAGALTTRPQTEPVPALVGASLSPQAADDLLEGAHLESVGPGVHRLIRDGAEHSVVLDLEGDSYIRDLDQLRVGADGSIWIVTTAFEPDWLGPTVPAVVAWQVGIPGEHTLQAEGAVAPRVTIAPDGTLWAADKVIRSLDATGAWTTHDPGAGAAGSVHALPDGSIWAAWREDIGRLGADGWAFFDKPADQLAVGTDRIVQLPDGGAVAGGPAGIIRFDGQGWQRMRAFGSIPGATVSSIRLGGDGSLWAHASSPFVEEDGEVVYENHLAQFDGQTWTVYSDAEPFDNDQGAQPRWEVDADGRVWVLTEPEDRRAIDREGNLTPSELWSFDGRQWRGHLGGVDGLERAEDGSIWVSGPRGTWSIRDGLWTSYPEVTGIHALGVGPDGTTWALGDDHSIYVIDADAGEQHGRQPHLLSTQQIAAGEDWVGSIVSLGPLPEGGFVALAKDPWGVMWSPDGIDWREGDPERLVTPYRPRVSEGPDPQEERVVALAGDIVAVLDRTEPGVWLGDPRTTDWRKVDFDTSDLSGTPDLVSIAGNDAHVLVIGKMLDSKVVNDDSDVMARYRYIIWTVDPADGSVDRAWLPAVGGDWGVTGARWFDGKWLLVADDVEAEATRAFGSTDGAEWAEIDWPGGMQTPTSITVGPSSIIATICYFGGDGFWYSNDGLDWRQAASTFLGHRSAWVDGVGFVITDNEEMPVSLDGSSYRTLGVNPVAEGVGHLPTVTAASSAGKLLVFGGGSRGLWLYSPA